MRRSTFHLLQLNCSILEQLCIEEALIRADERNWLVVNIGSTPAIVLGISGKVEHLVHMNRAQQLDLPLIRRFSGGGTVVVDTNTLFVTFIGQHSILPFPVFPEALMRWSMQFYAGIQGASLRENDYVIGSHKFGGNAQYLRKDRWLHHSSLLWDYHPELMAVLKQPQRTPEYRADRSHEDFICTLNKYFDDSKAFLSCLLSSVQEQYALKEVAESEIEGILLRPHRKSVKIIEKERLLLRGV